MSVANAVNINFLAGNLESGEVQESSSVLQNVDLFSFSALESSVFSRNCLPHIAAVANTE